jgi:sugar-specific transcriptional regulator TrmB
MNQSELQIGEYLAELGLKSEESVIYLRLLVSGSLSAGELSDETGIIVNSIYRSIKMLISKDLVTELDVTPKRFQAIQPSVGIKNLATKNIDKITNISDQLIATLPAKENPNRLNMELLTGRTELFDKFVNLAKEAEQEILVISTRIYLGYYPERVGERPKG